MKETKQHKVLLAFSQLWLSADEWCEPLAVLEPPPDNPFAKRRIVAWVVERR